MATAKKGLFKRIGEWFAGLWRSLNKKTKEKLPKAIDIVNRIKMIDDTHVTDIIVHLIPGEADDKILIEMRRVLKEILLGFDKVAGIVELDSDEEKLRAIIAAINGSNPSLRQLFYTGIAGQLINAFADGKFTFIEQLGLGNYIYEEYEKLKAAEGKG